jgi:hypothetical protein
MKIRPYLFVIVIKRQDGRIAVALMVGKTIDNVTAKARSNGWFDDGKPISYTRLPLFLTILNLLTPGWNTKRDKS